MRLPALFAASCLCLASPLPAQPQPRALPVPATAAWQHSQTELILPPRIGDWQRASIRDFSTEEQDVVADYQAAGGLVATVYLYKTLLPSVPVWFDRADLVLRSLRRDAVAVSAAAFAPPGSTAQSGLRATYPVGTGSTALAVAPLGGWLVKVRLSSPRLNAAALDDRLTSFVSGIRFPAGSAASPAATPVQPCQTPLKTRRARPVKQGFGDTLIGGFLSVAASIKPTQGPYCREPGGGVAFGVYRPNAANQEYVIALADGGLAIAVAPTLSMAALENKKEADRYAVTTLGRDSTGLGIHLNRLPPPEQVVRLANRSTGVSMSVSR
jgi:hypothetical protein